jgi:succinate dehydrogenase flavin-adding protein (antitoxin of CptAB toxin-antitoxin module)
MADLHGDESAIQAPTRFSAVAAFFEAAAPHGGFESGVAESMGADGLHPRAHSLPHCSPDWPKERFGEAEAPGDAAGHGAGAEGEKHAPNAESDDEFAARVEDELMEEMDRRNHKTSPAKRVRATVITPPTPASPAATPRDTTPRAIRDAKRRAELEKTAQMARIRIMQSPQKLVSTTDNIERLAAVSRLEAAQEAQRIATGKTLLFVHPETGVVHELTSSPLVVALSIGIPETEAGEFSTFTARPTSGKPRGTNRVLSEFVSFEVGDVTPFDSEDEDALLDETDDQLIALGENLSNFSDTHSARMLDSIAFDASYSARRTGFKPVVFLELSDMLHVVVDLPPGAPRTRAEDTKVSLIGLSLSMEAENFRTWTETPREQLDTKRVVRHKFKKKRTLFSNFIW